MKQISDLFSPLIGQLVWCVRRGHGSFLTMEFGLPHLSVREPISASSTSSERVRKNLNRRRVFVVGDWHFWIKYGEWTISTANYSLESKSNSDASGEHCLEELDGQILISAASGEVSNSLVLKFDLGATLEIRPSPEVAGDQWTLHNWNGDIAAFQSDGVMVLEKSEPPDAQQR
jgi:hypothetical protein